MYSALSATTSDLRFFLDFHGILIVCGGTAAAASICFSIFDVFALLKIFILRVLGRNKIQYGKIIHQFMEFSKVAQGDVTELKKVLPNVKQPFLREALTLAAGGIHTEVEIRAILEQRLKTVQAAYMREANMFRIIGRFPPAFGLLATTLGMIGLLQKIGQPDSQKLIGPAMSVGLIGTLYGIALANLVFIPIAENLTERTYEEITLRRMIIEGVLLLKTETSPIMIREFLNSYLLPKKRVHKAKHGTPTDHG